jgi:Cleavage and polyadenylation factor 2 C-terminal
VLESTNQTSSSHSASVNRPSSALLSRVLGARPTQRLPHSTMIGELKLTALKARLAAVGVQAEFNVHRRRCPRLSGCRRGDIAVRKSARGQVELEGTIATYITRFGRRYMGCMPWCHRDPRPAYNHVLCFYFIDTNCSLFEPGLTTVLL